MKILKERLKIIRSEIEKTCNDCYTMIIPSERHLHVEVSRKKIRDNKDGKSIWEKEFKDYCLDCAIDKGLILPSDLKPRSSL